MILRGVSARTQGYGDRAVPAARPSPSILLVINLLHPLDDLSVEPLLDRDVRHRRCWRRAVPVLLAGRDPHDVAWPNLLDGPASTLHATATRGYNQRLTEPVYMPGGSRAWFKSYAGTGNERGIGGLKQRTNPDSPGEPLRRPF